MRNISKAWQINVPFYFETETVLNDITVVKCNNQIANIDTSL